MRWTFLTYRTVAGDDEINAWYQSLSEADQAKVRVRLEYLRDQPRDGWLRPYFDALSGKCAGLGEIRFKIDRTQIRLVGFFGPERMQFAIVKVAAEKDNKFVPKDTCKIGQKRKSEIIDDPEKCDDWF